MAVKKITGVLQMLGNASSNNNVKTYSLMEMRGGQIIKNVKVDLDLDNFLGRAFSNGSEATLWLHGNTLRAIKLDGKTYISMLGYQNPILSLIFLSIGIPLCAVLIGFFVVYANTVNLQRALAINEILRENPEAIKL